MFASLRRCLYLPLISQQGHRLHFYRVAKKTDNNPSTMPDMPSESPPGQTRGTLTDYYIVAAVNSVAATLLGCSVYFWTRARFGYDNVTNLLLGALNGLVYAVGARWGGRWTDRIGLDRTLRGALVLLSVILGIGWLSVHSAAPFMLMAVYGLLVAPTWTALEGAILHAPSPLKVPRRVGIYNMVWSGGNTLALLLSGALVGWRKDAVVWGAGVLHAVALAWSLRFVFGRGAGLPLNSSLEVSASPVSPVKSAPRGGVVRYRLMILSWIGNSLAYLLQWSFFALLPHLAQRMGWDASRALWMTVAFFLTRCVSFYVLWQWEGWHDHPGWSRAALWAAPLFVGIVYAWPTPLIVLPALALLGAAFGLTYYASIYYTLEAGEAKATQGGLHEAMIGVGAFLGPLVGSGAVYATGNATAGMFLVVAFALAVNAIGAWAVRRWVRPEIADAV